MKLTKTIVLPLAALLAVGAAGAVLATSNPSADPGGGAVVPAAESPSPAPLGGRAWGDIEDTALADALDTLVADGTITADQKTAILDAVQAEREARVAERQAQMEALRDQWETIQGFLSDGEITQDELDQLPADSPLRELTTLMDDGKITTDELRGLGRGFMGGMQGMGRGFGHGFGHGFGPGGGMWGAPEASPAPDAEGSSS